MDATLGTTLHTNLPGALSPSGKSSRHARLAGPFPRPFHFPSLVFTPMIRFRPLPSLLPMALAGALLPSAASRVQAQSRTLVTTTQTEVVRRQSMASAATENLRRGDADMIRGDYEQAMHEYRLAVDSLPDAPATQDRRDAAMHKFFDATMKLAEQRITEGRYVDAETTVKVILRPEYNPNYKPAVELLTQLEDPEYYNKTSGPKFIARVQQVKELLNDASGFYDTGRYDLAYKRYEQVLSLDPYNDAARKGEERVDLARTKHSETTGYPATRGHMIWDIAHGWELPVRHSGLETDSKNRSRPTDDSTGTVAMNRKLQRIMIPHIEFRSTTISDAVEYLRQESARLDTESSPDDRGVNIFLKLPVGSSSRPAVTAPVATEPAIPGLPTGADAGATAPVAPAASANTRISLTLSNIPLLEALRYVAQQANLKVKVEQYAVSLVPFSENIEVLVTREFRVAPNFISSVTSGGLGQVGSVLDAGPTSATAGGNTTAASGTNTNGQIVRQDAESFLKSSGVQFPPGASATYLPSTSKLIVRNTQENIDLVEALVNEGSNIPKQVSIESKFIEVTQTNLKELGFDWTLGNVNIGGSSVALGGGTVGNGIGTAGNFPFVNANGNPVGTAPVTSGLRSGSYGIQANAVDALLFGSGAAAVAPGVLSLAGVMTDPQFQVVVHALNQQKGVDLLSAPRVTTKSGQKATVEIIQEFIYPTQFQPPQIPQTIGATSGVSLTGGGGTGGSTGSFPVTPTTPTAFEKRNTGVTLEVEPVIGPDNYTIDLNLQPQVVEFDGFINYGSPIQTVSQNALGITTTNTLTANVINQPVFDTRKVSTSVSVYDGATVVLGGLVREDIQKVNDKVPVLGDLPIAGRLFRSKIDQNIKRNLIIFVTARLIDPSGMPILNPDEEEEVVQPLNGPDNYVQPTGPLPLFPKK